MKLEIIYTKQVDKFIKRNRSVVSYPQLEDLLRKGIIRIVLRKDVNVDLVALRGVLSGYFRIRYRKLRIIFSHEVDGGTIKVTVHLVDFRGNVYR